MLVSDFQKKPVLLSCCRPFLSEAVAALLQPIQQTQQQQAQELSDFKVMLEELKGGHSEVGGRMRGEPAG